MIWDWIQDREIHHEVLMAALWSMFQRRFEKAKARWKHRYSHLRETPFGILCHEFEPKSWNERFEGFWKKAFIEFYEDRVTWEIRPDPDPDFPDRMFWFVDIRWTRMQVLTWVAIEINPDGHVIVEEKTARVA